MQKKTTLMGKSKATLGYRLYLLWNRFFYFMCRLSVLAAILFWLILYWVAADLFMRLFY